MKPFASILLNRKVEKETSFSYLYVLIMLTRNK